MKLGEANIQIIDGDRGKNYPNKFTESGYCLFLNAKNVTSKGFSFDSKQFISKERDELLGKGKLQRNDVILTTRGTVGNVALYDETVPYDNVRINSGMVILRCNQEIVNPRFLYYTMQSEKVQSQIFQMRTGSAQPQLPISHLVNLEIDLPDLTTQRTIAATLSTLDAKIAINTAINQRLEQIAQAIFKSWFVDNVTDDWFYVNLGSVTTEIRTRVKEKELPVLSAVKTGNLVLSEDYFTKQVYSKDISKYIVVAPNNFAYNPARINIGSIGINDFDFTGCVSPVYVVFRTEPEYHHFFRFFIKSSNFQEEVRVRASGSVRQSLNYRDFALIEVIYPPIDVVRRFNSLYEPIHTMQRYLEEENTHLAAIRDALLPRLMSGELSAPALENIT